MTVTCEFEGLSDLEAVVISAVNELRESLMPCAEQAGCKAISAMQANHPYTDRTGSLTQNQFCTPLSRTKNTATAVVDFNAHYANIVDGGSRTARPYPFTPIGIAAAEVELEKCMSDAAQRMCDFIARNG